MAGNGDGNVPIASSSVVDATEVYLADAMALQVSHDSLLGNAEIQKQVLFLLRVGAGIWGSEIRTGPVPPMNHNAITLTAFSPVRLRVFDSLGNHTGLLPDG